MQIKYISTSSRPPSLLRKTSAVLVTTAVAAVALMFSAVLLTVLLSVGALMFAYLWWKTRELRKQMRNFPPPNQPATKQGEIFAGEVIEGEAIRVDDPTNNPRKR